MAKSYYPLRVPKEFRKWMKIRHENIKKKIQPIGKYHLTDTMRLISKTNGINIDNEIIDIEKIRLKKRYKL